MKRFIGFLMMVLFIGAFTGFGNTITDLAKNSEKVITVSADSDFTAADVFTLKMVTVLGIDQIRPNIFITDSFIKQVQKNEATKNVSYLITKPPRLFESWPIHYTINYNKIFNSRARDKLTC